MSKRIIIILSVLSLLIILLIVSSQGEKSDFVEGRIIDFEQTSLTTFSSIRIIDSDGKEWEFHSEKEFIGFFPSHLQEHIVQDYPVKIRFELSKDSKKYITEIWD
jgi:hypothetical protein